MHQQAQNFESYIRIYSKIRYLLLSPTIKVPIFSPSSVIFNGIFFFLIENIDGESKIFFFYFEEKN